jgi:hypothetical protein
LKLFPLTYYTSNIKLYYKSHSKENSGSSTKGSSSPNSSSLSLNRYDQSYLFLVDLWGRAEVVEGGGTRSILTSLTVSSSLSSSSRVLLPISSSLIVVLDRIYARSLTVPGIYVFLLPPAPLANATCIVDIIRGGLPAAISARETSKSSWALGSISVSTII